MANGLRKLIRRTRKQFNNPSKITRRLNRFGPRLKVEELEERIAPAAIAVEFSELVVWDADATDPSAFIVDGDGAFFMTHDDTGALSANITMGDATSSLDADAGTDATHAIWVDFDAATLDDGTVITIVANGYLGAVDLSNLTIDDGNSATINIVSGTDMVFGNATPDTVSADANGAAVISGVDIAVVDDTISTIGIAGVDDVVDGAVTLQELTDGAGIGAITLPTVASGDSASLILNVSAGGEDGAADSSDGDITSIIDSSAGTLTIINTSDIYCDDVGVITVDAMTGTVDIAGDSGDVTGNLTVAGDVATLNIAGTLGDSVSDTAIFGGNVTDLDVEGVIFSGISVAHDAASIDGAGNVGAVDVVGELAILVSGGTLGVVEADTIGTINAAGTIARVTIADAAGATGPTDGAGTITSITTSSDGNLGAVTTIGDTNDGGDITALDIDGDITGAITVDGTIFGIYVGGDVTAVITTDEALNVYDTTGNCVDDVITIVGSISGTGGFAATGGYTDGDDNFSIGGDLDGYIKAVTGNIDADITVVGEIGATTGVTNIQTVYEGGDGDINGDISVGTNLAGSILSDNDITGGVTLANGDLTGSITAANDITTANIVLTDGRLSGSVTATAGAISAAIVIGNGTPGETDDDDGVLAGLITAPNTTDGNVAAVTIAEGIVAAGSIVAGNDINGQIIITDGDMAGAITAGGGINSTTDYNAADVNEDGVVNATDTDLTDDVALVLLNGDLTGAVTAGDDGITEILILDSDSSDDGTAATHKGTLTGTITSNDEGNDGSGDIAGIIIDNGITGTSSATASIIANDSIGDVYVNDEGINEYGAITATQGAIGDIAVGAAGDDDINDGDLVGAISAGTAIGAISVPDGNIVGDIDANTSIGAITVADGDTTSDTNDDGNITSTITAGTTIGAIFVGDELSGDIVGGADQGHTGDTFTGGATIGNGITEDGSLVATYGDFAAAQTITIADGGMAGLINANDGSIKSAIDLNDTDSTGDDADLTGTIQAAVDISGNIEMEDQITDTGQILASGDITGNVTVTQGDMDGVIIADSDITGTILIDDGDLTGEIKALTGNFGATAGQTFLDVDGDIVGGANPAIVTADGSLLEAINVEGDVGINLTFDRNVSADISAGSYGSSVTITVGGSIVTDGASLTIEATATDGDLPAITVTGDISSTDTAELVTITATGSVGAIIVGGDIVDATAGNTLVADLEVIITADSDSDDSGDITSIAAGGAIEANITGENIGTITSGGTAANDITGIITAASDVDGVDAGFGTVSAVVHAGAAASGSPLGWVVAEGVAYCVWALNPSTGLEMAGITVDITFNLDSDDNGVNVGNDPEIIILDITGTILASPVDLKIVTVIDNGADEPTLEDTDIDLDDIGSEVVITLESTTEAYLNDLVIEGQYTDAGGDLQIHVAGATLVEGGIGGTFILNLEAELDYAFRSIAADTTFEFRGTGSPTITVLEGVEAGFSVTIGFGVGGVGTGTLAGFYVGDASMDKIFDIGAGSSIAPDPDTTLTIGEIVVAGDVDGSISAAVIGDVVVGGGIGVADNTIFLRARAGSIGDVSVTGNIDMSLLKAEDTTNQALATIGMITAGGNIAGVADMTISAGGTIGGVHAGGVIGDTGQTVTITTLNGGIGEIIADGSDFNAGGGVAMRLDVNVDGDIGLVSSTIDGMVDNNEDTVFDAIDAGRILGTIQSRDGDIGTVQTVNSDINATIKALTGDIDEVKIVDLYATLPAAGNINSPLIAAGGDIDLIQGNTINANTVVTADTATGDSAVTKWIWGTTKYEFTAEGGGDITFSYKWENGEIDITVNNQGEIVPGELAQAIEDAVDGVVSDDDAGGDDVAEVVTAAKGELSTDDGKAAVDTAANDASDAYDNAATTASDAALAAKDAALAVVSDDDAGGDDVAEVIGAAQDELSTDDGKTAVATAASDASDAYDNAATTASDAATAAKDAALAVVSDDDAGGDDVAEVVTAAKGELSTDEGKEAVDTAASDASDDYDNAETNAGTNANNAVTAANDYAGADIAELIADAQAALTSDEGKAAIVTAVGAETDPDLAKQAISDAVDTIAAEEQAGLEALAIAAAKTAIETAEDTIATAEQAALEADAIAAAKTAIETAETTIATAEQAALEAAAVADAKTDIKAAADTIAAAEVGAGGEEYISIFLTTIYSDTLVDPDGSDELQVPDEFDLNSLDFTIDSTADDLATLHVEGSVNGLIDVGSVTNLIVQGNVAVPVQLADSTANPVEFVAMSTAMDNDDPTAAEMEAMFAGATFSAPAVGTEYEVPVTGLQGDVSVSIPGDDGNLITPVVLNIGDGEEAVATFIVTVTDTGLSFVTRRDASGTIEIDGDLDYIIFASDLDAVTITGSVTAAGGIDAYDIGDLTIGTQFDLTDGVGDLAGFIRSIRADNDSDYGDIGDITIYGNILEDAYIYAEGNVTSITVGQIDYDFGQLDKMVGSVAGEIIVLGTCGDITSEDTLGGLIMIGGNSGNITSNESDVTADIFIGGTNGDDAVAITGNTITGDLAIGAIGGVDSLTLSVRTTAENGDPVDYTLVSTGGAGMLVEVAADAVSAASATIAAVTVIENSGVLTAACDAHDNFSITNVYVLENAGDLNITVPDSVGMVAAANGMTPILTSSAIADTFSTDYDLFMFDMISPFDAANADDADIPVDIDFTADSVGGVVATGNVDVSGTLEGNFGYIVSINGDVGTDNGLTAANIGDIFGYGQVGTNVQAFTANNTLGTDGGVTVADDLDTLGLSLPVNFAGGVMSVTGDIRGHWTAYGNGLHWQSTDEVMGAMTALSGHIGGPSSVFTVNGDFGGLIAPLGDFQADLFMPIGAGIDMIIVPNYDDGDGTYNGEDLLEADLSFTVALVRGETIITQGSSFIDGTVSVTTDSAGVIAYVDDAPTEDDDGCTINVGPGDGIIATLYIINGLGAGDAIDVNGSVTLLIVDGDYAGSIDMIGMYQDTPYEITTLRVNGNIDVSSENLDLNVYDFDDIEIEAGFGVINDTAGVSDGFDFGTLNRDNMSVTFTNPSNVSQTVALKAGSKVQMDYDMYFGKMTDVTLTGRGGVQIVSTEALVQTARDVSAIVKDTARYGLPQDTGTAVMGDIDVHGFDRVKITGLVVDGNMGSLDSGLMNVRNLYINGSADDVSIGGNINGAFINGSVGDFFAEKANNVTILDDVGNMTVNKASRVSIDGNVASLDAYKLNRVFIDGANGCLYMGYKGSILNSVFGGVCYDNIDHREVVPVVVSSADYRSDAAIYGSEMTNPNYNPVKVRNSVLPGVDMYLSDINKDDVIDGNDAAWVVHNED